MDEKMKRIVKPSMEPLFFTNWKKKYKIKNNSPWEKLSGQTKRKLLHLLIKEQGGICCYCEQRLVPEESHIEHLKSRHYFQNRTFDFYNLFCSCGGGDDFPKGETKHCGHKKSDKEIFVSPLHSNCNAQFTFLYDGTVKSKKEKVNATIDCLGLNTPELKALRNAVIEIFIKFKDEGGNLNAQTKNYLKIHKGKFNPFWTTINYLF
jgi:uncharacterized protein (TIGR02646 family)